MEKNEKINLVKRNTVEILMENEVIDLLNKKESFEFYWGIAPTGPFHIGYLIPVAKI
ncbi:MAG: hypothetical protein J7K83_02740 [Candidatus Aenigmarchaeota archaeon]|nr:hypothetical protein [Candidatus Aenigmarchaeota archaeon]